MRSIAPLFAIALLGSAPLLAAEVVPVPAFQSVQLRGGGSVVVRPGPAQRVTIVNGSSRFTHIYMSRPRELRIDACNSRCPRNYDLRIEIQSPRMPNVGIQGGGSIVAASGFAPQNDLAAAVDGGGQINVRSVRAGEVSAAVNGGGKIAAAPVRSLSAAIHGGGEIAYSGNPAVSSAVSGGGAVHRD